MAVQELNFQGINRAITDYAVTGACEELINIRPTSGGLVPVKDFTVKMQDFPYDAVYVHYAGGATNHIAIFCGADGHVDIVHIAEDGSTISVLKTFYLSDAISSEDIHFAYTGNIVLVSICKEESSIYRNASFIWDGERYEPRTAGFFDIPVDITIGEPENRAVPLQEGSLPITDQLAMGDILETAFSQVQAENNDLCFGTVLIAVVLRFKDGTSQITKQFLISDVNNQMKEEGDLFRTKNFCEQYCRPESVPYYANGGYGIMTNSGTETTIINTAYFSGAPVRVTIGPLASGAWDDDTSLVRSVEIYSSAPRLYYDYEYFSSRAFSVVGKITPAADTAQYFVLPAKTYDKLFLEEQLLYLQGTVELSQITSNSFPLDLKFGGSIQLTQTTLEVDSGEIERFGKILSYNARFHYYDSTAKVGISMPKFYYSGSAATATAYVFVRYNNNNKDEIVYVGTDTIPSSSDIVVASSIQIREVITIHVYNANYYLRHYAMTPSQRYNFSICTDGSYTDSVSQTPPQPYMSLVSNIKDHVLIDEPDAINVTEQYNPFVFKVEHSYLAPGKVLDIQPQMVAVRDVTFGDYPLNVFTDRGTYALLQGNGQVLYGNFRSMSNLVSMANSVPTEHGTFFLAAGGLWAVAGSDAILISDALHLGPHKYIRDCAGYQALSASGVGYNVANYVSEVPFEEFTKCAKLSYNRFRDELIVSNNFYRYSYVLSLKYRQWFKIDKSLFQDNVGVNIAKLGNKPVVATVTSSLVASVTGQIIKVNYIFNVQRESGLYTRVEITLDLRDEGDIAELLEAALQETILSGTAVTATVDSDNGTLTAVFSFPATITGGVNGYTESLRGIPPTYSPTMVDSTSNMSISRTTEVIDLSEETDGSVRAHLQSRPFSFNGFGYSHVHRIVDMVRTALAGSDKLIVGLYGSDDLQNWTLLSYGVRTSLYGGEPLEISQLRTPPAARSWRYYTVCIGGTIPADTDFGPVLVDYEPVIRRLG